MRLLHSAEIANKHADLDQSPGQVTKVIFKSEWLGGYQVFIIVASNVNIKMETRMM